MKLTRIMGLIGIGLMIQTSGRGEAGTPVPPTTAFTRDLLTSTNAAAARAKLGTSGSGGSATNLTPWPSAIDAAGFSLTNAGGIVSTGTVSASTFIGQLDGSNLATDSVNSNKFDAATRALLGGGSGSGIPPANLATTNTPANGTFLSATTLPGPGTNFYWTAPPGQAVFDAVILPGDSAAQFQAGLDAGGSMWITESTYTLTTNIYVRKPIIIYGNHATLTWSAGVTSFCMDTRTNGNIGGSVVIRDLTFDGAVHAQFNGAGFFHNENGQSVDPFYNPNWTNRSGLRLESSGGGIVEGCTFLGWQGNGLMIFNLLDQAAHTSQRLKVFNNTFCTNFVGMIVPGANFQIPGYYNSPPAQWPGTTWGGEYTEIIGNYIFQCQYGAVVPAGNASVTLNQITDCKIGLFVGTGGNSAHGIYGWNTLNHNSNGAWSEGNQGGLFLGNLFLANTESQLIVNGSHDTQVENNWFGGSSQIVMTNSNGSQTIYGSVFKNNHHQGTWGVDFPINFDPQVVVSGNIGTNFFGDGTPEVDIQLQHNARFPTNAQTINVNMDVVGGLIATNASFTFARPYNVRSGMGNPCVVYVTNSSGSTITITPQTAWHAALGTWNATNVSAVSIDIQEGKWTNAICTPLY